ncbi:MAG: ureidoglycolate lyase [Steroidobacteraceae bacterium]
MTCVRLPLIEPDVANFAPFGRLLAVPPGQRGARSDFYGDAVELYDPGAFVSDADTRLSIARVHPRARSVRYLERHFKHTQAFVPLTARPFVAVLGPPCPHTLPDVESVRAFRFPPGTGFMMHIGTWHEFPFALESTMDLLVILRNETNRDLERRSHDEAEGADLQKRNVQNRLGVQFEF